MAVATGNAPILREIESLKKIVEEAKEAALAAKSAAEDARKATISIKAKDNKIINLSHFPSIEVSGTLGSFNIQAVRSSKTSERVFENIATFEEKVDADYVLCSLFEAIRSDNAAWNVNTVKSLSALWSKVKTDNESLPILERAEISVIDLGKVAIAYPSKCRRHHDLEDQKEKVKSQLINALGQNIKIRWEPSDDLNRKA